MCLVMLLSTGVYALDETKKDKEYIFPHAGSPKKIKKYSKTVMSAGDHNVSTMRGDMILNLDKIKLITDFDLSPTGNSFALVMKSLKKGNNNATLYRSEQENSKIHSFDVKLYGQPSCMVFTPDSRQIILATEKGIFVFDNKKFKEVENFNILTFTPEKLYISPNGYFLVATSDEIACVINLETKKVRKEINAEIKINDVAFSPNSSLMAILTSDGLLSVYDTRTMEVKTIIDNLGEGLACDFNDDGKYVIVATGPEEIELINIIRTSDRRTYSLLTTGLNDIVFITDDLNNTIMTYTADNALLARRLYDLEPYYSKLISETVDSKMNIWLKMQPGEALEDYNRRVNEQSIARQRRLFEDEISTELAGDILAMSDINLGNYDRTNGLLAVEFSNLPSILLPVSEKDIVSFTSGKDLTVSEAQYGILPDDSFELIYAKFHNKNDNQIYIYDNLNRKSMELLASDANFVSLDILRQQQMEEIALQELKKKVIDEAKHNNIISDHTTIAVDSKVVPDYDADGNKILNYVVKITYQVDPEYSAIEDFGPGKYQIEESGAASSMMKIVKQAFDGDLKQYIKPGKKLLVNLSGTADASPILRSISYDGRYGEFEDEPILSDGVLTPISVTGKSGIATNPQLALIRAAGIKDFLEKNINGLDDMIVNYNYSVSVSKDKGGAYRRISAEFIFPDAF